MKLLQFNTFFFCSIILANFSFCQNYAFYETEHISTLKSSEFKGKANGLFYAYFIEGYKYHIAAFNEDMKQVSKLEVKNPKTIKNCKIHDGVIFNDQFYLVLTGKNADVEKGKQGIFLWAFNGETGTFADPMLVDQVTVSGGVKKLVTNVSSNGEFISFLVNFVPVKLDLTYHFSLIVLNKELKRFYADNEAKGDYSKPMILQQTYLSNTGNYYIVTDESTGEISRINFAQKPSAHAAILAFQGNENEILTELNQKNTEYDGFSFIEHENKLQFFLFCTLIREY